MSAIKRNKRYNGDLKAVSIIGNNDNGGLHTLRQLIRFAGKGQVAESPHCEVHKNGEVRGLRNDFGHSHPRGSLQFIEHVLRVGLAEETENRHGERFQNPFKLEPVQSVEILVQVFANGSHEGLHREHDGNIQRDQHASGANVPNCGHFLEQTEGEHSHHHDHHGPEAVGDVAVHFGHFVAQGVGDKFGNQLILLNQGGTKTR